MDESLVANSPWADDQYALLDFGNGRKLERFGAYVLDRSSPAAEGSRPRLADWSFCDARLDRHGKIAAGKLDPQDWQLKFGGSRFQLKLTPFGHVGLFPEQAINWRWLTQSVGWLSSNSESSRSAELSGPARPIEALNLFAYTGGSTLALAAAGASIVHVDASAPAVSWARGNAALSGLQEQPMRWIVDDVRKFVQREIRRERRYRIVVLDPPSFGHGPGGKRWSMADDLAGLLDGCVQLLSRDASRILITGHSESLDQLDVARLLNEALQGSGHRRRFAEVHTGRLCLVDQVQRKLDAGYFVRCELDAE